MLMLSQLNSVTSARDGGETRQPSKVMVAKAHGESSLNEETSVQTTNLRLRNQWGSCPPNGYRYVFPEDGFTAHAWTYVDWINEALNHAHANNLPNPDPSKMEEQFCMTLPPG